MNRVIGLVGVMFATGLALPAAAQQIDAGALTCEAFLAMDAGGKAEATNAVTTYVADAANADTTAAAAEVISGMDDMETQRAIDAACVGAAPGMTVPMALENK